MRMASPERRSAAGGDYGLRPSAAAPPLRCHQSRRSRFGRLPLACLLNYHEPETRIMEMEAGISAEAESRTATARPVTPRPSAEYAERTPGLSCADRVIHRHLIIIVPAILAPFPDIPMQVVKTPPVGGSLFHLVRHSPAIRFIPTEFIQSQVPTLRLGARGIVIECSFGSRPAGLPLGLGRQTCAEARHQFAQSGGKFHRIVPSQTLHGKLQSFEVARGSSP